MNFSYEMGNFSYETVGVSYEIAAVSYEIAPVSYEMIEVSYENAAVSHEMAASSDRLESFLGNLGPRLDLDRDLSFQELHSALHFLLFDDPRCDRTHQRSRCRRRERHLEVAHDDRLFLLKERNKEHAGKECHHQ